MRILFASSLRGWGGGEEWFTRAPSSLAARGHRVALAARRGTPLALRARAAGLEVHEIDYGGVFDPHAGWQLRHALESIDAEVALGNLDKEVGALALAALDRPQLALVARRGSDFPVRASAWNRWLYGRRVRAVLTNSPGIADTLSSSGLRIARERIAVIPNGLDPLAPTAAEIATRAADWPAGEGARVIAVGELTARKNPLGVLEALRHVRAPWRLLWIGAGPERDTVAARAAEYGIASRVRLLGAVPEARRWTAAADLLVHFSDSEGQPWAVLEALVEGVPVVASRLPGLSSLLEDGATGWIVDAGDVASLAAAIDDALGDPAPREERSREARARVRMVQSEAAIYERLERRLERARLEARGTRRAVFLDRDGTLIPEVGWLSRPDRVRLLPGVGAALRALVGAEYAPIVVSNQAAIGRGKVSAEAVRAVNARLRVLLRAEGVELAGIFVCPHRPEDRCDCRKPKPGLLRQAHEQLGIDLTRSWMIGDSTRDTGAADAAGVRAILLDTGWGGEDPEAGAASVHRRADRLVDAARWMIRHA